MLGWLALLTASFTQAQQAAPESADSHAGHAASTLAPNALPGFYRVAIAAEREPGLALAATGGYGFIEEVAPDTGSHHRLQGSLAAGVHVTRWLGVGLAFDGRFDFHPDDPFGADESGYGLPRIDARFAYSLSPSLTLGLDVRAAFPGEDAPSIALDATTIDAAALLTYASGNLWFGGVLGYRFDQSANGFGDVQRLRPGEIVTSGASVFDAIVTGIGIGYGLGDAHLLAELSWDMWVGSDAPSPVESPLRFAAGVRYGASDTLAFELISEARLTGAPEIGFGHPLVAVEPRFSMLAGLRYGFPFASPHPPPDPHENIRAAATVSAQPVELARSAVRGRVLDHRGDPVPEARVHLRIGDEVREATTGEDGSYVFDDVPAGDASIAVDSEGFDDAEFTLRIPPAAPPETRLSTLPGQLRGLIRSFRGDPLTATVRVEPGGMEAQTDQDGMFTLDLPPGDYDVTIEAARYESQDRSITIERNGVTILNVDLRRQRR